MAHTAIQTIPPQRRRIMKRTLVSLLIVLVLAASVVVIAQVNRPFRHGSVWNISFIKMKPGMETAYLNYVADEWKREQEALKKDGQILSYKVITTEAHGSNDWNIMLMSEYKDLATQEANEDKADALAQKVVGSDEKQMQGYRDRLQIREVLDIRTAREITLEPKR